MAIAMTRANHERELFMHILSLALVSVTRIATIRCCSVTRRTLWVSELPVLWFRARVVAHPPSPIQEPHQLLALPPHEAEKLHEPDLLHLEPGVRLDPPAQIRRPPRSQSVPLGRVPSEP